MTNFTSAEARLNAFRKKWAGRKFQDPKTGIIFQVPDDVYPKQFFEIGEGFLDVGDGYYARYGGGVFEVKEETDE